MPKRAGCGQARSLTAEQLERLAEASPPKLRAVVVTCRFLACRISEALALRWENLGATDVVLPKRITKGKTKTRSVPLHPRLADALGQWRLLWESAHKRAPDAADPV